MEPLSVPNDRVARVNETFEIKEKYKTGHAIGLVTVLDRRLTQDAAALVGKLACVRIVEGQHLRLRIDDSRDHGAVISLFFKNRRSSDIPIGSEVVISGEDDEK